MVWHRDPLPPYSICGENCKPGRRISRIVALFCVLVGFGFAVLVALSGIRPAKDGAVGKRASYVDKAASQLAEQESPEEKICRICYTSEMEDDTEPFISPCSCSGTQRFVHLTCFCAWRRAQSTFRPPSHCGVCNSKIVVVLPHARVAQWYLDQNRGNRAQALLSAAFENNTAAVIQLCLGDAADPTKGSQRWNKAVTRALLANIEGENSFVVLQTIAQALTEITNNNQSAFEALVVKLLRRSNGIHVLKEIAKPGDGRVIQSLLRALVRNRNPFNPAKRHAVLEALGELARGDRVATSAIVRLIRKPLDVDSHIASLLVASGLTLLQISLSHVPFIAIHCSNALHWFLTMGWTSFVVGVRLYCTFTLPGYIDALGKVALPGDVHAIQALLACIEKNSDMDVTHKVVQTLRKLAPANHSVILTLIRVLRKHAQMAARLPGGIVRCLPGWTARRNAAYALGELAPRGDPVVINALLDMIERDGNANWESFRISPHPAAQALGKLIHRGSDVLTSLIRMLGEQSDMTTRRNAIIAIGETTARGNQAVLLILLAHVRKEARRSVSKAAFAVLDKVDDGSNSTISDLILEARKRFFKRA